VDFQLVNSRPRQQKVKNLRCQAIWLESLGEKWLGISPNEKVKFLKRGKIPSKEQWEKYWCWLNKNHKMMIASAGPRYDIEKQ